MNLAARRSARLKEKLVMRLGCLLVSFAVLASLVLEPPRAKAEALTLAAVGGTALVAAYLGACGMMPYITGMDRNGVNESVARMIQDFLDDTFSGGDEPSGGGNKPLLNDWLGMITFTVLNGVVRFGKEAADKLNQFAQWVAGKYGTKPGVNQVYEEKGSYVTLQDGRKLYFAQYSSGTILSGTVLSATDFPLTFSTNAFIDFTPYEGGYYRFAFYNPDGTFFNPGMNFLSSNKFFAICRSSNPDFIFTAYSSSGTLSGPWETIGGIRFIHLMGDIISADESLSLDVAETVTIPEDLTDSQSVALDVGATDSMSIQEILQGILDAILAGDLVSSAEIVDTAEIPVEPPEEPDPPVVPELPSGLDKLGAALTSRFPFSIPWDIKKGVTLLAAPPKAPYFEVDFMAPIAYRVGGWKGSTKIVLDMSEYEIIGQVCRWTSTIGFCLFLASGTKRLIWTA